MWTKSTSMCKPGDTSREKLQVTPSFARDTQLLMWVAGSLLRISTVSGIHGALGDNGQTYKTLAVMLGDAKKTDPTFKALMIHGCGQGQREVAEIGQEAV